MIDHEPGPMVGARGITFEQRVAISALATSIAVLLMASGLFIFAQWRAERSDLAHARTALAQVMSAQVTPALARGDLASVKRDLSNLAATPGVRLAEIQAPNGAPWLTVPLMNPAIALNGAPILSKAPLILDDRSLGQLTLISEPVDFRAILPRYIAVCGALFFAAAALALFVGRWLASRVIHPVNQLSQAMRDVTDSGDYSERVPGWAQDEFGQLTESFNTLLAQLQANDTALHRAMNDLVEARDAAQAANVLKSQFLANMSHEIRTPLNGVLTMAQIMALGELPPAQRARIEVIRRSGEDLLAVLNDILDLSKIEAGKMEIEEARFEVEQLEAKVHDAFDLVAAAKKHLNFGVEVRPDARGARSGDLARLNQVLGCLISNALKFTAEGQVRVTIEGYGQMGEDGLRIQVTDTGIGIPADKLPLLFQKFSQADGSNTRRYGGTGLGLAISRELARLMRGSIEVDSIEGRGSTFTLVLPLPRIGEPSRRYTEFAYEDSRTLKVLAAEDIPTNQLVLRTILQSFGAALDMVENGQEAVEAWRRGDYDLILMDIQMPVMDGVTATRTIRDIEAQSGRPRTPIIAVSANAMSHQVQSYLEAGMDAHVAKPIELVKLHSAMDAAMAGTLAEQEDVQVGV
ncbi:MAG: ATP-binding protein [Caulobacteraceae bacterium]|nr:ATP-binding protein [Caulobacteraceae bacterium]